MQGAGAIGLFRAGRPVPQIHLNARAMTPNSAADISSHQTRSKARAACSAANDFSMLIAKLVTKSFTLSVLVDSFWSTLSILADNFWSTLSILSPRRRMSIFMSETSFWMCSTFASSLATRSSKGVSIANFKAGNAMGGSQHAFQLMYIVLQHSIETKHLMLYGQNPWASAQHVCDAYASPTSVHHVG